jgi:hypothetical protein
VMSFIFGVIGYFLMIYFIALVMEWVFPSE